MPLALSSNETWRYWLRADRLKDPGAPGQAGKDLPYEKQDPHRPHFLMRYLTGREQRALAAALDAVENAPKAGLSAEYVDMWFAAVKLAGVAGHRRENELDGDGFVARVISPENIEDIPGLGYREAHELAYAAFSGAITPGDLGNSASPSSSAGVGSANPAGAAAEKEKAE